MSTLQLQLVNDVRTAETYILLKDRGLGTIKLDELPRSILNLHHRGIDWASLEALLSPMYFYCCPRVAHKVISMTFDQAVSTSQFLKEIV